MNSEKKLAIVLSGYLTLVCFVIAMFHRSQYEHFLIGLMLGSLFGFAILAACWIAYGPGRSTVRWPLACLMLVAVPLSFAISMPGELILLLLCQIVIVVLLLLMAALIRLRFGIRLIKPTESASPQASMAVKQYGIRHLMIITTVIAVFLSVGRLTLPFVGGLQTNEFPVFLFLAFTSCVICVPFLFALLALRDSLWPTLALVALSVLATWRESTLLASLELSGPDFFHFVWINFFTVLPVLLVAVGLRKCGYRLIGVSKPLLSALNSTTVEGLDLML